MTIIYCKKLLDCGQLFQLFKNVLNEELSEPIGAPDREAPRSSTRLC